ncbi:MarR family winged helix-turn-helix transcriptional regulator [Microbacterium rhizophilus]|uniref:MarR family winged helix-turn-helix transcriptional regulator n=1 Tax=Microbacterium rhizophilus TaxID=3138934 RepID=UPI0031EC3F22
MSESAAATSVEGSPEDVLAPETEEAIVELEQQFALLFQRIRSRWKDAAQQVHPDLSPTGYKVLSTLAWGGASTATQLSELLAIDKSVLSRQLVSLQQLGLIERHADEDDGRVRVLAASAAAIAAVSSLRRSRDAELRRELASWPHEDVSRLAQLLKRLATLA